MAAFGKCSECGEPLTTPQAKTCSPAHRAKRSRRLARQKKLAGQKSPYEGQARELAAIARDEAPDIARDVVREELRPIAREAITEDVLRSINSLVGLTGKAVQRLTEDLDSVDAQIRQRAYSLLLRYTVGNQSVAPTATAAPAAMNVVFNVPGPGDTAPESVEGSADTGTPSDVDAVELRECIECHEVKPIPEFVGISDRCQACHDALHAKVAEMFPE